MSSSAAEQYKEKGNAEYKNGNYEKAIEFYTYATEMDPKNHIFYTNRSMCYAAMKKWDKSLRDANKSLECNKSWEKGYYRRGVAQQAQGQLKEAVEAFEMAMQLNPKSDDFKKAYESAKKEMFKGMPEHEIIKLEADDSAKAGKTDQAITKYTSAIEKCLKYIETQQKEKEKKKDSSSSKSDSKSDDSESKDTEKKEDKEAKAQSALADLYVGRAVMYQQLYEPFKVRADCNAALKINENHIPALLKRGQSLESIEKYKAALEDFERVLTLDSQNKVAAVGAVRTRNSARKSGQI